MVTIHGQQFEGTVQLKKITKQYIQHGSNFIKQKKKRKTKKIGKIYNIIFIGVLWTVQFQVTYTLYLEGVLF